MEHRRPSIIGPLILITAGVLFLLANMGMLPFTFWELAVRFWPIILILIGLEIIFGRRSLLGALVILVLWVGLVAGVIWVAYAQGGGILPSAAATTEELSQPLGDIKSATVDLNVGFSNTTLTSLSIDAGDLMKGTFSHGQGTRMVKTYNVAGSDGRLSLREEGSNFILGGVTVSRWDLALNPSLPVVLRVDVLGAPVARGSLKAGTALGSAFLAALAGMIAAPASSVYPGMGTQVLIICFVVVVIGGIGSLSGALVAALVIGLVDTFGKVLLPQAAGVSVYVLMAGILLWRPEGLFRKA